MKKETPAGKSSEKAVLQHNGSQGYPQNDKGVEGDNHSTSADSPPNFDFIEKHRIPEAASGDTFNTITTYVYSPSVNYTSGQSMWLPLLLILMMVVLVITLLAVATLVVVLLYTLPQLPVNNAVAGTPTTTIPLSQQEVKIAELPLRHAAETQPVEPSSPPEKHAYLLDHSPKEPPEMAITPNRKPEDGMEINLHAVDIESYNESNTTASNSQGVDVREDISEGGDAKVENSSHEGRKKASKGGKVGDTSNSKILGGEKKNAHAKSLHQGSFPIEHSSFELPHTCFISQVVPLTPTNHPTLSHQSLQEYMPSSIPFHPQVGEQKGNLPSVPTHPSSHTTVSDIHGLNPQNVLIDIPQRTRDKHVPCHPPAVSSEVKTHLNTQLPPTQLPQPRPNEEWLVSRTIPGFSPTFSMLHNQCPWHNLPSLHPSKVTALATLAFLDYQPLLTASSPKMKVINIGVDKHPDKTSMDSIADGQSSAGGSGEEWSSKWAFCRASGHNGRDLPKKRGTVNLKDKEGNEREGKEGEKQSLYITRYENAYRSPEKTHSPQKSSPWTSQQVAVGRKVAFDEMELVITTEDSNSCYINFYPTNQVGVSINTSSLEPPQLHPPSRHMPEDMQHPLNYKSQFSPLQLEEFLCISLTKNTKDCFHPSTCFSWVFDNNGSIPPLRLEHFCEQTLARSPFQKQEHTLTAPQMPFLQSSTMVRIQDVLDYSLSSLSFVLILLCFHFCRRPTADGADSSSVTTRYPHLQENSSESTHFLEQQKELSDCSHGKQQSSCPPTDCTTLSDYEKTENLNTESTSFNSGSTEVQIEEIPWKVAITESGDGDKKQSEVAGIQEYICPPVVNVKDAGGNDTIESSTIIETYFQPMTFREVHKDGGELTAILPNKKTIQWIQEKNYHPDLSELIGPKLPHVVIMDQLTLPSSRGGMLVLQKSNINPDPG